MWWSWTPNRQLSQATITTNGSNYDTALAIYTGSSISALSLVEADDDDGEGLRSSVTFTPQVGVTYQIHVDGYRAAQGDIQLNYPDPGSDGNDYAPIIIQQPVSRSISAGASFELTVEADGDPAPSYQWLRISEDGVYSIPYATLPLSVDNASTSDSGFYAVSVSNYQVP